MHSVEKDWFKVSILIIIIVAIALIFVHETKQQQIVIQQQTAELNASCRKLALEKKVKLIPNKFNIKNEITTSLDLYTYEYKYNQKYKACILAYTGYMNSINVESGSGFLSEVTGPSGHVFEIDNLSTGESVLSKIVEPHVPYIKIRTAFYKMQAQYIGSTTPAE